jgi:glycosyltransferase involved in cell wall biosynthesis
MAIRKASAVIAVSSSTASDVCSELPTCSRKVSVIHLGASKVNVPNSQQVVNSLEVFGEYVLFVGTQEPRKNLHNLLGAYGRLKGVIPHLPTLVIAGGTGWGNVHVNDLVLKFDLQSHVRTLGYVSEAQLSALYEHSMFLAMPSFYEGFGLPIAEAIVHGRPVLTSCTSSMPEVAANAGLYVDPSSIASIEEGLRKLISDPKKLSHLAENARLSAARFDWDKASDKTRKIFEESTKEPLKSSHDYRT